MEKDKSTYSSAELVNVFYWWCKSGRYADNAHMVTIEFIKQLHLRSALCSMIGTDCAALDDYIVAWTEMVNSGSVIMSDPDVIINMQEMIKPDFLIVGDGSEYGMFNSASLQEDGLKLSCSESITPLSVLDVHKMKLISDYYEFEHDDSYSMRYKYYPQAFSFNEKHIDAFGGVISANINIQSYTDDEIICDLKRLLKAWRDELNVVEPDRLPKVNERILYNSVRYNYMLLLDSMIFKYISNGAISDQVIIDCIYSEFQINVDALNKTHKKMHWHFLTIVASIHGEQRLPRMVCPQVW